MNDTIISVIVPVFKTEKYIYQCVDSIINQTYKKLEIILVDDGSPDNCGKICDEYAQMDDRIKVIHKENGGLVSARKAGVAEATGDYITFVDSDDYIDDGAYAHAIEAILANSVDVFIFGLKRISETFCSNEHENISEGFYSRTLLYKEICKLSENKVFYNKILSTVCWNKIFKADIIKSNIVSVDNSIKVGEDTALIYPSLLDSESFFITHEYYYNYRKNNNSMMNSYDSERYTSVDKVVNIVFKALVKHGLTENEIIMYHFRLYTFDLKLITDTCHYISDIRELYPEITNNSKILIYGKGVFAQNLKYLIEKDETIKIIGFVDSSSTKEIMHYEFDYIIVAVTIASFAYEILDELGNIGLDKNKILYLKNDIVTGDIYG